MYWQQSFKLRYSFFASTSPSISFVKKIEIQWNVQGIDYNQLTVLLATATNFFSDESITILWKTPPVSIEKICSPYL